MYYIPLNPEAGRSTPLPLQVGQSKQHSSHRTKKITKERDPQVLFAQSAPSRGTLVENTHFQLQDSLDKTFKGAIAELFSRLILANQKMWCISSSWVTSNWRYSMIL